MVVEVALAQVAGAASGDLEDLADPVVVGQVGQVDPVVASEADLVEGRAPRSLHLPTGNSVS